MRPEKANDEPDGMTRSTRDILLTGGTGFLGHYLLAELLARPQVRCRVLIRPPLSAGVRRLGRLLGDLGIVLDDWIQQGRVQLIEGALPDPIGSAEMRGVTDIVHAAANTAFDADVGGEPARTNVDGTRALLEAAEKAGVRRFVFISTAYVCGERSGRIAEDLLPRPAAWRNAYEQSKWEAEQWVRRWRTPWRTVTICRPSILFGARATGRATVMNGLYLIARATELLGRAVADDPAADRHHVPLRILGRKEATANLVPVDWAAERVAEIVLEGRSNGMVHHVTNPDPPTQLEIKRWLEEYFDLAGGTFSDESWPLANPNHYEELFYSMGNILEDYFRDDLSFVSRNVGGQSGNGRLVDRDVFFRCLRHAQATNWGRQTAKTPAAASAGALAASQENDFDPKWYFEEFLPRTVPQSKVAQVDALTTVVRFVITEPTEWAWMCRFEKGQLAEVCEGRDGLTEAFGYRISYDAFKDAVAARTPLQSIFFDGRADMFGDIDQALKMVSIMRQFLDEFPVAAP